MKLRFYTDIKLLPNGRSTVIMLYPFFGLSSINQAGPDEDRFEDYMKAGREIFVMTSENNCDVFVLPFDFSFDPDLLKITSEFSQRAADCGKRVLVFFNSDDDRTIPIDNLIVYRTSFYLTGKSKYEFSFPGWSADFMKAFGPNAQLLRTRSDKPVIGYCGYVDYIKKDFRQIVSGLFRSGKSSWVRLRGMAVRRIMMSDKVSSNFIIRNGFWAEGIQDKKKARMEYVQNLIESDYAIVCRGGGNFSYRLYEVMSLGRVPVFINTDCVLPFMELIPWQKLMVWVESEELADIDEKIIEFHQKHNDQDFLELQKMIRRVYEEFISPVGFFTKMSMTLLKEYTKE